jgi:hypothetical protein
MTDPDLDRKLQELAKPNIQSPELKGQLRLTLADARVSSSVGLALVAIPSTFLFAIILNYGFGIPIPGLGMTESLMQRLDNSESWVRMISPLVLAGGPLIALALNLLAIMHVGFDAQRREMLIAVKLRILNLLIIGASAAILLMLLVHIASERGRHLP